MSTYEQNDAPPVDLADIRWKMLVACDVCRRRKVRCDGQRPCVRCSKGGKSCTFSTPRRVTMHPEPERASKRPRTASLSPRPASGTRSISDATSPGSEYFSDASRTQPLIGRRRADRHKASSSSIDSGKEHLLLIDPDDQIVYSGPSTGMPLFARLGLLRTVEVSETEKPDTSFASHSASALGMTGAAASSDDYFDLCLQHCPRELMTKLIGYHLTNPIFFPLLHAPSFSSEFSAITQRRLACTAQYGALLMSILAVTVRLVESARVLLSPSERHQAGEAYSELAQDFLRISKNKLDIRYILALYHLALFAEGRNGSAGLVSSYVSEAVGLAFTTGLHRSSAEFNMDPVTLQVRTRLFWALYTLDASLAHSQGRPLLIRLSECSVELPVMVANEYIKKTEILPQPEDDPPLAIAAAVKMIEIYMVLEQVLSAINGPSKTRVAALSLSDRGNSRREVMKRAQTRLDEIQLNLPSYLSLDGLTPNPTSSFLFSCRVRTVLQFVRTLIARQTLIDELDAGAQSSAEEASDATLQACRLSVDTVKTYSRLRHLGLLRFCGFHAVSHVTAAAHTLIACMLRRSDLAFEHRPDLLTAIDILLVFSSLFPHAETVAQLLVQLSRSLDHNHGSNTQSEAVAIRVLARRMARSPSRDQAPLVTPALSWPSFKGNSAQRVDVEHPSRQIIGSWHSTASTSNDQSSGSDSTFPSAHEQDATIFSVASDAESTWPASTGSDSLEPQWMYNTSDNVVLGDSFSFLNDGLFNKL